MGEMACNKSGLSFGGGVGGDDGRGGGVVASALVERDLRKRLRDDDDDDDDGFSGFPGAPAASLRFGDVLLCLSFDPVVPSFRKSVPSDRFRSCMEGVERIPSKGDDDSRLSTTTADSSLRDLLLVSLGVVPLPARPHPLALSLAVVGDTQAQLEAEKGLVGSSPSKLGLPIANGSADT